MIQILKVDEWESNPHRWYVADVKTFTGWRAIARTFGITELKQFKEMLVGKYHATIESYNPFTDFLLFTFDNYANAHKFKLDVNRIARKQNIQVEKWVKK